MIRLVCALSVFILTAACRVSAAASSDAARAGETETREEAVCSESEAADKTFLEPFLKDIELSTAQPSHYRPSLITGEKLFFDISWSFMTVGTASLETDGTALINGREAVHIKALAKSGAVIDAFFKVSDRNDSWLDTEDLSSFGYYKRIQEGRYYFSEHISYGNGVFEWRSLNRKHKMKTCSGRLYGKVNDVLSALYRVRTMKLEPGDTINIAANSRNSWNINVKVLRRETIKVPYGERRCLVVEPLVGDEGIFMGKKGKRMFVWLTDDEEKIPVKLKAEIFIGAVTADLVKRDVQDEQ